MDCELDLGDEIKWINKYLVLFRFFSAKTIQISAAKGFSVIIFDLNSMQNANEMFALIQNKSKSFDHFAIILNFDCQLSPKIIDLVWK